MNASFIMKMVFYETSISKIDIYDNWSSIKLLR